MGRRGQSYCSGDVRRLDAQETGRQDQVLGDDLSVRAVSAPGA